MTFMSLRRNIIAGHGILHRVPRCPDRGIKWLCTRSQGTCTSLAVLRICRDTTDRKANSRVPRETHFIITMIYINFILRAVNSHEFRLPDRGRQRGQVTG